MSALTKELSKAGGVGRGTDKTRGPKRGSQDAPSKGQTVSHSTERMLFIQQALIGHQVRVQVKNGAEYSGILHATNPSNKDLDVVLKHAKLVKKDLASSAMPSQGSIPTLKILSGDVVQLTAEDVALGADDLASVNKRDAEAFSTDAELGGGRSRGGERELQRWEPSENDPSSDALESLPPPSKSSGRGAGGRGGGSWDQFKVNQNRFGVKTSFDESIYTTKLDPSRSRYSKEDADRLAAEIEGQVSSSNAHLAEERGMEVDDEEDEEARYSSVVRPGASGAAPLSSSGGGRGSTGPVAMPGRANGARENGDAAAPAWAGTGAGVNAVSGRQGQAQGQGGAPTSPGSLEGGQGRSAPIAVDPRREHNKVRMQLTQGGARGQTSPYGTPKGMSRSPLDSPLVGNAAQVEALDLNPGTSKFDVDTRKEFRAFKLSQQRTPEDEPSTSTPASEHEASSGREPSSRSASHEVTSPTAAETKPGARGASSASSASGTADKPPTAAKSAFQLNPSAKAFSFNPKASTFVPGTAARPSTAAPAGAAAQAASPAGSRQGSGPLGGRPASAQTAPQHPQGQHSRMPKTGDAPPSGGSGERQYRGNPNLPRPATSHVPHSTTGGSQLPRHQQQHHHHQHPGVGGFGGGSPDMNGGHKGPGPMGGGRDGQMAMMSQQGGRGGMASGGWMPQPHYMQPRPYMMPGTPQQQVMFVARPAGVGSPATGSSFILPTGMGFPTLMYAPSPAGQGNGVMYPGAPNMPFGMPIAGHRMHAGGSVPPMNNPMGGSPGRAEMTHPIDKRGGGTPQGPHGSR
ncbi:hypothetical protein WJX73_010714 [Symbiochloris irregularis]|uniref:LsmAD domain-containing protein n=1 Tax=Symbiochloris irregularis TaxID=706552 RepID=A0AAW1PBM6_9CHLO